MRQTYPNPSTQVLSHANLAEVAQRQALQDRIQSLVNRANEPFVEVAGPTQPGPLAVRGIQFARGMYISNVVTQPNEIDLYADSRHMPFKNRSLGGVIVSCLPAIPTRLDHYTLTGDALRSAQSYNDVDDMVDHTYSEQYDFWANGDVMNCSPRYGLLREIRRVVRPGGLYITATAGDDELSLAKSLGFEVAVDLDHVRGLGLKKGFEGNTWEHVLRLEHTDTPAGLFVESLSERQG